MKFIITLVFLHAVSGQNSGPETDIFKATYQGLSANIDRVHTWCSDTLPDHVCDEIDRLVDSTPDPYALLDCDQCLTFVRLTKVALGLGQDYWDLRDVVLDICYDYYNGTSRNGDIMCPGYADTYGPHIAYILNVTIGTARDICLRLQHCHPEELGQITKHAPLPTMQMKHVQKQASKRDLSNALKVAHFTDIHVDIEYIEGSATDCGLMVCCRDEFEGTGSARRYGDQGCNIPPLTVEVMLNFTREQGVDYVMYTGDNNPGDQWQETQERQIGMTVWLADIFARLLPDTPTYPVIGNHETFPTNLYYIERPEIQELNEVFLESWDKSADFPEDQKPLIEYAGYYTILLKEGLRLIAYNSNYGYNYNWYNLINEDGQDFRDMKDFLDASFAAAEEHGEKVFFIGHHPTGDQESAMYYSEYITELSQRYGDIIIFHIFGHYHTDQFKMIWNMDTMEPRGIELVQASLTTSRNPSMRIFYVDPDTFELLDYDQYFLDLDEVSDEEPDTSLISLMYRATEEYGLADMSPQSWANLLERFEEDDDLFQQYYRNLFTRNGPSFCDAGCKKNTLCNARWPNYYEVYECKK